MRLDALTIAGLTGATRSTSSGVVGVGACLGARASASRGGGSRSPARSPARSDATLGSIEDSFKGGSSVLSDELGEIVFTDDEHDVREDGDDDGLESSSSEALEVVRLPLRGRLDSGEVEEDFRRGGEERGRKKGQTSAAAVAPGAAAEAVDTDNVGASLSLKHDGYPPSPTTALEAAATAAGAAEGGAGHPSLKITTGKVGNGIPFPSGRIDDTLRGPHPCARPPCATVTTTATTTATTTPTTGASPIPSPGVSPPLMKPPPASTASIPVEQPQQQQAASAAVVTSAAPNLDHHRGAISSGSSGGGASRATARSLIEEQGASGTSATARRKSGDLATLPKAKTASRDYSHGSGTTLSGVGSSATSSYGDGGSGKGVVSQCPRAVPTATCKVLVVGNAKCGKSSIISRFVNDRFSLDYNSTVGADYAMKDVHLRDGRQVCLYTVQDT